ncbi:hypothetical protein FRC09_009559, partial [Ceratobasidium sp. 395]
LYLSRSGTCLIHVDLVIHASKVEGCEASRQCAQMFGMLRSILGSGGARVRWSSFALTAGFSRVFYKAIEHTKTMPTPNLRFVSLQCQQLQWSSLGEFWHWHPATADLSHTLETGPHRPLLRSVELLGLPEPLIFSRPKPFVSNLRRLALGSCSLSPYTISNLSLLFSACAAQLESLSLDAGSIRHIGSENPPAISLRVSLPSLRFLSLEFVTSVAWAMNTLRIIDAPNVEVFLHDFCFIEYAGYEFMRYICSGRLNGALQEKPVDGLLGAGPLFPSLHTLALPNFSFDDTILTSFFEAYTRITKALLNDKAVEFLCRSNRPLRNLKHLRCLNKNSIVTPVKKLIRKRRDWGMKLSSLELVAVKCESVGWESMEAIEKDFERDISSGLVVRVVEDRQFGWLGVYDI